MKFETLAIRLQSKRSGNKEHSTAIYPTSSFVFDNAEQMRDIFSGEEEGNIYSRFTNPTCREFEEKIAALEKMEDAMATATGMAAVFAGFAALLRKGDHILVSRAVFGSTFNMMKNYLQHWGIEYTYVHPGEVDTWEQHVKPNSKMLYLETPSNPGLALVDLEKASQLCKKHNLLLNVDNCFATPYLQNPADWGADIVIHSATKFIDGQGRVLGGVVAANKEIIEKVHSFVRNTGPSLSPFNAWILTKSLETLAVRMDRHCDNAEALASWLESRGSLARVNYPFLDSHPDVAIARKQMRRGGGIVTFELEGGLKAGQEFLNALKMLSLTANLGDSRSIASHPASTTHARVAEEDRLAVGITPGLIRISCGLEHIDDIIADIDSALSSIQ